MNMKKFIVCTLATSIVVFFMPIIGISTDYNIAEATKYTNAGYWGIEIDDSSVYEIEHRHARALIRSHGMHPHWSDWHAVDIIWWSSGFKVKSLDPRFTYDKKDPRVSCLINYIVDLYGM